MKIFEFEKQGIKFSFRNPEWIERLQQLVMEWKVEGIKENEKNNGYYYNSTFIPSKNAMELDVEINSKTINGVILPEDILIEVNALYEQYKQEDLQKRLYKDIEYTLHDTTAYGIYNGISQSDIAEILSDIKKQYNSDTLLFMFPDEVVKILNKDEELKQIALDTYIPYPVHDNWSEEIKKDHERRAKEKIAAGYGIIPNKIIREKVTAIVMEKVKEEQAEQERINNLIELAKQTGKKQLIEKWIEECNDDREQCNVDICYEWAMPDGTRKLKRYHTW